jgi:hypothetical protein
MRVRTKRQTKDNRRRGTAPVRPALVQRESVPADDAPAQPRPREAVDDGLADERRLRDSGGPHDRAEYACSCGFVWWTDVSASVSCPHCGSSQAW